MADDEESDVSEEEERQQISEVDHSLFEGIRSCNVAAIQQSLRNGANVNCVRVIWFVDTTPLFEACQTESEDIFRILLDAGANARWNNDAQFGGSVIAEACSRATLSIVQLLLNHDAGLLEISNRYGDTPLAAAICSKQSEIFRFLLDRGANIHATNTYYGKTTLMQACEQGNLDIVRMLLVAGMDVEARDERQRTALHYAAGGNSDNEPIQIVRELILEHNANICNADEIGDRPFDSADDVATVNFLIEMYSEKLTQEHGRLALHAILGAMECKYAGLRYRHPPKSHIVFFCTLLGELRSEQLRTLLQSLDTGLIRNRDDSGKLPMHIACQVNAPVEVLSLLVEMDPATLQIADHTGALPIHLLCCNGTSEYASVKYLVEQGGVGTLAARDRQGALPLHILCGSSNPRWRTVQYLIQSFPGSVEEQTNTGQYPFRIAAGESSAASLSVLFELARANPGLVVPW